MAVNEKLLEAARSKVADKRLLINGVSKRAAELSHGGRPMVPSLPNDERNYLDIALQEVAEGKIVMHAKSDDDAAAAAAAANLPVL